MYKPYPEGYPVGDPGRGHFCIARLVEARSAEDPGLAAICLIYTTPKGCRTDCLTGMCDTLAGSYTLNASSFPAVFGTSCLDTRAKQRRSLRGFAPAGSAGGSSRAGISRQDCTATGIITSLLYHSNASSLECWYCGEGMVGKKVTLWK